MYLTNGTYFIALESSGKIVKTKKKSEAHVFGSPEEIQALTARCKKKTSGYYPVDGTEKKAKNAAKKPAQTASESSAPAKTPKMPEPSPAVSAAPSSVSRPPAVTNTSKRKKQPAKPVQESRPKVVRKQYVEDVRRLLYKHAEGRCAICGHQIRYSEMTLDHIIPLSSGGPDEVENLQCTCLSCNQLKGDLMPEQFPNKIYTIFRYQMDQKHRKNPFWNLARLLLFLVEKPKDSSGSL